ncbi:MAG: SNF2-related protein [Clostridium sp.]
MKVSELEDIILKNASKLNISKGRDLLKDNSLKIDVHKVDNVYNIYGNFKSSSELKNCNPHLRIDIKNKKLIFTKCSCSIFKENDLENRIYLCDHLVGAGLKFVDSVKRKIAANRQEKSRADKMMIKELQYLYMLNTADKEEIHNKKEKLEINVSIKEVKEKDSQGFDVSIYIGNTTMYPVLDIKECIESLKSRSECSIGKGLVYNSRKYYFDESDEKVIDYIYEFLMISKNNDSKSSIRIPCNILRRFLENLDGRKVKFTYNYQNYFSEVLKKDLPLTFTMKKIDDNYVLTTKKVFPVPLNKNMDIFLFDRNLYIPSYKQIHMYNVLYKSLKENKKIIFKDDISSGEFYVLNKAIVSISEKVFYDEAILKKLNENVKVVFNFSKRRGKSICDVSINNGITDMGYSEAVKINNDNKNFSSRLYSIERILNKYRFYYRNETFEFLGDDEEYYLFLKNGIDEINSLGSIFVNKAYEDNFKLYGDNFKEFSIQENSKGTYDFYMQIDKISPAQLQEAVKAYKDKKRFIRLDDGMYIDLTSSEFENAMRIIDSLNLNTLQVNDKYELSFDKLYYLKNKLENDDILKIKNRKKLLELFESIDRKKDKKYHIPKKLNCVLREYQKEGYNWFRNLSELGLGGILGDEMGLGKTIQTIAFLSSFKNETSIIIVPTSLLYNWKNEFEKFSPHLKICILHGEKRDRDKLLDNYSEYDVILTTYGTLKNDSYIYEQIHFKNVILDEGQNIKNYKAQITQAVKKVNGDSRFILTGTPIENNLTELWSLFDFIMPGYLYSYNEFNKKFVNDDSNIEELKILIKPYILRRRKIDAAYELPEKHEKIVRVKMTKEQKNLYDAFVKEVKENIECGDVNNATIFSYITKLRQLCLDPSIVTDEYKGGSGKIQEALNIIKNEGSKHKILLFSQFTSTLKKISRILGEKDIHHCYLDGSISSANRIKLVDEFNSNDEMRVFLISLKAGGTGLNLTSADMVIHFDPWWNPSIEDQATDRAHRIGQENDVEVIKLIAENTIEEKIVMLQEDKKHLINDVLTSELNDTNILNAITSREIIDLLK